MAQYDVQVVLHHVSKLPENDFVNTLHYEVNAPDTIEGLADEINAAYLAKNTFFSSDVDGMTVKIYAPGLNPTGPVYQEKYTNLTGGAGTAPYEVACCLSYATVNDPAASTPRRRGRIYIGPLNSAAVSRPDVGHRDSVLDIGEALAAAGTAGNTTWLMRSQTDGTYHKIESIWCDDAWDVQRRRGLAPTMRETRDVQ